MAVKTIEWRDNSVRMIDQRLLPAREVVRTYRDYKGVAEAIRTMVIRGAPAIGVAAAMGVALGIRNTAHAQASARFAMVAKALKATRPTAVNLAWAIDRMGRVLEANLELDAGELFRAMRAEAIAIYEEDLAVNRSLGKFGNELVGDPATILTHCNAGALATAGYGTALGVVRAARDSGKNIQVYADETRPFLQGSRLTAWELRKDRIPVTIIADSMAATVLSQKKIDCVVVGTDRTAANGDVANKIGTYPLAVMARRHGVPFYVAAPLSSIDLNCPNGAAIPIEERAASELTEFGGKRIAPAGVLTYNPAFDVTPAELVTAIITERGIAYPPYTKSLRALKEKS
ncbi:MAG: S-methyl-5-thioribose-1-phosphate isomerase [Candidatus Binatus sp.]|uniref:S-methyl-5-thioribose-1-phosphate isomerase n=1 Tax=Candidatus Binatus sp. TaxID=2811406 RepID=UPI0027186F92|nr:S-methyl-5-thioribose-1-phosphate isomerase [Candidatus Binatus sp.]MDO8431236.1 S-methyl-5-thioribose-1-phosphate isomerase [Candidatus Binatus sp.]